MADASTSSRRRPLYTCGASTLTIVWNLYRRVLEINGPIGLITRRLAELGSRVSPLVCVIQYQCLSILWFVDSYILFMEKIIETILPFSRQVFNKVDYMIDKVDDFPRKVEHFANNLPVIIHRIPPLSWAVMVAIKWLEVFASVLVTRGLESAKEKEIRVDTNCNEENRHKEASESTRNEPIDNQNSTRIVMPTLKCSYKEALEKGVKEDVKSKDIRNDVGKNILEDVVKSDTVENDDSSHDDPLLDLFESGWVTPKGRIALSRSASCN
ncbi:hypothetical protein vseg_001473 [Gypsophila vaccaria]